LLDDSAAAFHDALQAERVGINPWGAFGEEKGGKEETHAA
jgi:hypothetical protein